ncbi:retrovirus-related pol polyprotein from transposon TNT 1-94 [Tanacetum coccineum]
MDSRGLSSTLLKQIYRLVSTKQSIHRTDNERNSLTKLCLNTMKVLAYFIKSLFRELLNKTALSKDEISMAPVRTSSGPEPFNMTPGQLKSGLAPTDKELYFFNLQTNFSQDAPSTSASSSTSICIISQTHKKLQEGTTTNTKTPNQSRCSTLHMSLLLVIQLYAVCGSCESQDSRRSTSGSAQFLGDRLVSWSSKKQRSTAISTTEAEYIAMSGCCAQILWMRSQLKGLMDVDFNKKFLCTVITELPLLFANTMAEQNVPTQPPTRTDEQIVPRSQWLIIGKSNLLFNAQKIQKNPIFQISVDDKYGYMKNHMKTVKNGQTRTQERKSEQKPKAKPRKVNLQSILVNRSQPQKTKPKMFHFSPPSFRKIQK